MIFLSVCWCWRTAQTEYERDERINSLPGTSPSSSLGWGGEGSLLTLLGTADSVLDDGSDPLPLVVVTSSVLGLAVGEGLSLIEVKVVAELDVEEPVEFSLSWFVCPRLDVGVLMVFSSP